jgi:hypothetical protein
MIVNIPLGQAFSTVVIEFDESNDCNGWRIQPVDATSWLNRSAGVS